LLIYFCEMVKITFVKNRDTNFSPNSALLLCLNTLMLIKCAAIKIVLLITMSLQNPKIPFVFGLCKVIISFLCDHDPLFTATYRR
jgi:hypothetical protein